MNIDQSETLFVIILNLDQWIRCCVKSSSFSSGDYSVKQSRSGCVVLVEGLTRNVITNCMKLFQIWTSSSGDVVRIFLIMSSGGHLGWQSGII